jgi:hypothetical protein
MAWLAVEMSVFLLVVSPNIVNCGSSLDYSFLAFSPFKCPSHSEITTCAAGKPTELVNGTSRTHCGNVCRQHGWNWFNFIEDSEQHRLGQCQLLEKQPEKITERPRCSLYTVSKFMD